MDICVFCGSSPAIGEPYTGAAESLGHAMGERGHGLVFGGYAPVVQLHREMLASGFMTRRELDLVCVEEDPCVLLDALEARSGKA